MDRNEFEQQALEHLDAVYRMAFHLARRPDEAEDIVQEVYARAFRPASVEGFRDSTPEGGGGMRAWLFTICHNVFYSRIKREARQPTTGGGFPEAPSDEPRPDEPPPQWDGQPLDPEHIDSVLRDALDELKPEYRQVLLMWGVEGLKYREIAAILDVPIGTVMSRLHRARKLVGDRLMADPEAVSRLGLRPGEVR
jgi:RNA polymerase sigma-70 factor (ECF subfamily)